MAASRATNKKVEVLAIKPVFIKRKVGRPSAAKIPDPIITPFPVNNLMASTERSASRRNYDVGEDKVKMDNALQIVLQSKGRHTKRTALTYGIAVKSLVKRYNEAVKALANGPQGTKLKF